MAFIKKLALGSIFISIICIFAMSHNTSAFSMVLDYDNYESVSYAVRSNVDCTINGTLMTNQGFCTTSNQIGNFNLTRLVTSSQFSVKSGDIVNFKVVVFSSNNVAFDFGTSYVNNQVQSGRVIGFNEILNDDIVNFYHLDTDYTSPYYGDITGGNYISRVYEYFVRVSTGSDTYQVGLNSTSSSYPIMSWYSSSATDVLYFKIVDVNVFRYVGTDTNAEQEQKTQNAVDDSENAGNSSSQNASQSGASLLSAIGGFFSVITSASPTNCVFNAPLNTYFGSQRLNVDLCALDTPPQIGALTSIIAIGVLIPFAINMFRKFISLFRSFQS